jgi:HEAT repeat protein
MSTWNRVVLIAAVAVLAAGRGRAQVDSPFAFGFAESGGDAQSEGSYQAGTKALDGKQWDKAVESFNSVPKESQRADAALYWKAYALNKLGRRQEALAAIGELQKHFASSRWVNDAKALELEVRQAAGHPVSPDAESDEDLKLMAINSLMHTDPERAIPLLEKVLKGNYSPKYKERALFVLLQTGSPRARQIAAEMARANTDPGLQMKAIESLGLFGGAESRQTLSEIYASSSDVRVKRQILQSFMVSSDRGRLLAAAKSESNPELRRDAIQLLGVMGNETAPDLLSLYAGARDKSDRKAVIQALFVQDNAKALVDLARKETDPEMKKEIVRQLSVMDNKEATDYMMEILNK